MMARQPLIYLIPWILILLAMASVTNSQSDACGPNKTCDNGGVCITAETPSRCQCAPGYTGEQCQTDIDWCLTPGPHDCRNNAPCVDGLLAYSCDCLAGWEGEFCERETDECQPNPCQNGGVCTDKFDSFSCACPVEFSGETCQDDVDECKENITICQNNGTCQNSVGGFNCSCEPGFTGQLCETEIDECASNPCFFGGKCIDLINNFRCECQPSFVGPRCQGVVNQCVVDNPCQAGGACVNEPGGGYTCFCPPGYYGPHCELEVNVCASRPCLNGATCTNLEQGYSCRCATGYSGSNCETDINECEANPCKNGGTCNETTPGRYSCDCVVGFEGSDCEVNVDECQNNTCQGQQVCVDLINEFRCVCQVGKTGALCETDLVDCSTTPCENGGVCSNPSTTNTTSKTILERINANIPQCVCPSPYIGQTCSESTDVCVPQPCQNGGACLRDSRGNGTVIAKCACVQGYIGDRCETLAEDCRGVEKCRNGGECVQKSSVSGLAEFFCECPGNFTGTLCEVEPSGCLPDPCQNNATCTSLGPIEFECQCLPGWIGPRCAEDVDECLPSIQPPVCQNQGACVNLVPGYRCVCSRYWKGPTCETDVPECDLNVTFTCKNNGTCREAIGGPPTCDCLEGYTGADCSVDLGQCEPNPCRNNGTCSVNATSTITCQCAPGYTGKLCDANIDECTVLKPCHNNATCIDGINSFTCQCHAGWEGATCDIATDPCADQPCENGGTCQNATDSTGFLCHCAPGYVGLRCEREVNECGFNPCRNNATCIDLVNAFRCECLPGYTGVACNVDIDECASNPCSSQATCVEGINSYTCICPAGFEGPDCKIDIDECASSPCQHGGKCSQGEPSTFNCSCPSGVIGVLCEFVATATFNGASALTFNLAPSQQQSSISSGNNRNRREAKFHELVHRRHMYSAMDLKDVPLARYKRETGVVSVSGDDSVVISQVQFTLATSIMDGILLVLTGVTATGSPQHVVLEMEEGVLYLSANDGSQLLTNNLTLSGQSTSGIINHVVQLNLAPGQVEMRLNPTVCDGADNGAGDVSSNQCRVMKLDFAQDDQNGTVFDWSLNGQVYFGGVSEITPYTRSIVREPKGFVGCLGNLMLNGQTLNLADSEELSLAQTNATVSAPASGCPSHSPCLESFCANGGTCQDLWLSKTCSCTLGFSGEKCEFQNMANFESEDMLHFAGNSVLSSIEFYISAANGTGLVLYTVTTDSLSLSLDNGQLRLQLILSDTGRDIVTSVGQDLHLQGWMKVTAEFTGNQYKLDVTKQDMISLGSMSGTAGSPILVTGPLYMGALHAHTALDLWRSLEVALPSQVSFKGCIRDVVINSQHLDLTTNAPTSLGNDPPSASPGCEKEEACLANPCANQGACVAGWAGTTCKCAEGFDGVNCTEGSAFTFDGTSSYSFISQYASVIPFGDSGEVEFRTRQNTATILFLQFVQLNGQYLEFRTFAGMLQVHSNITEETVSSNSMVSDGQWHKLNWTRSEFQLNIQLDGQDLFLNSGLDPNSPSLGNLVNVYIGVRPFFPAKGRDSQIVGYYKGCIRWLKFNNENIPFAVATANTSDTKNLNNATAVSQQASSSTLTVEPFNLISGCQGDDVCQQNPCPSNAYCVDDWNMASCPCLLGWEGVHCNISVDDCVNNLCQNRAVCVDGHVSYTCICSSDRFTGPYCDTLANPCLNDPPCNSSTTASCVALNETTVDCICKAGFTGESCDKLIDNCLSFPCLNNGSCINAVNSYVCECLDGYSGIRCEDRDPCISDPCNNGGICLRVTNLLNTSSAANSVNSLQNSSSISSSSLTLASSALSTIRTSNSSPSNMSSTDTESPFSCECPEPYYGSLCQSYNFCAGNLCRNNASCVSGENRYTCQCRPGFYGTFCEFEDYCASLPCQHDAECRNEADTYICLCPFYFTGKNCETAINQCEFNICFNGATCIFNETAVRAAFNSALLFSKQDSDHNLTVIPPNSQESSSSLQVDSNKAAAAAATALSHASSASASKSQNISSEMTINSTYCICALGFAGDNCQFDVDECDSNPCQNNGSCRDSTSRHAGEDFFVGFRCTCPSGFFGDACEFEKDECSNSSSSPNSNQNTTICLNGGICEDLINDFRCRCPTGFAGSRCEDDVRGCASSPCQNEARCQGDENDPTSYTCLCETGFTGTLCEVNIDDCVDNQCENKASCKDGIDSYSCVCLPGYSGVRCETVVDACYSQPCYNGGQCLYQGLCSCPDVVETCGWQDEACQVTTCAQRPDCQALSVPYLCNCTGTGYTLPQCAQDEDECELSPCLHGGVCSNSVGSYSCNCLATGYHGRTCQLDDDECESDQACYNGGTCENLPGSYRCDCPPEWEGSRCGQNRDDCRPDNPCLNGGRCQDKLGDYQCDCTGTGFEGKNCTDNVDDCVNHRCEHNGICVDGIRQYTCLCDGTGYTGQFCQFELVSLACSPSPCQNSGQCNVNSDETVSCNCTGTGFSGVRCQEDVDECQEESHGCQGGSTCVNTVGSYSCDCGPDRTGAFCETDLAGGNQGKSTSNSSSSSDLSAGAIAGVVFAFIIVIILILAVLAYAVMRRRRTSGRYKPSQAELATNGGAGFDRRGNGVVGVNGAAGGIEMVDTTGERMI